MIESSGWPGTMSNRWAPVPRPAAPGGGRMPRWRASGGLASSVQPGAVARGDGRFADAEVAVFRRARFQRQAGGVGGALGVVAMPAVDVEIGACAGIERGVFVHPVGVARCLCGGGGAGQIAKPGQVLQLVLLAARVVVVTVEMARLRGDR